MEASVDRVRLRMSVGVGVGVRGGGKMRLKAMEEEKEEEEVVEEEEEEEEEKEEGEEEEKEEVGWKVVGLSTASMAVGGGPARRWRLVFVALLTGVLVVWPASTDGKGPSDRTVNG